MLENVEWGEYKLGSLFEISHYGKQRSQTDLQRNGVVKYNFVMQNDSNNGVTGRVPEQVGNHFNLIPGNSISAFTHLNKVYYQEKDFYSKQGSNVYTLRSDFMNKKNAFFIISAINSVIGEIEYGKNTASRLRNYIISLPTRENKIDFDFMERFISVIEAERVAVLESYLSVAGLKDYHLSPQEQKLLDDFESGAIAWGKFKFRDIFDQIAQGRRLKKSDQIPGDIPFVMAGVTNTGVVNYISNPVASFPKNSVTIDIFGNAFYRSYNFGAGDDTGVYWGQRRKYTQNVMLFFTSSMGRALKGKFDYGNKLRSSQSLNLDMQLLTKNGQPDLLSMETFISVVQKLVIKDVVLYLNSKSLGRVRPYKGA